MSSCLADCWIFLRNNLCYAKNHTLAIGGNSEGLIIMLNNKAVGLGFEGAEETVEKHI